MTDVGRYDNLYHLWSKNHKPNQCRWNSEEQPNGWEEFCEGLEGEEIHQGYHWRCKKCKLGTGNQHWTECPYGNDLEHIVLDAYKELGIKT